MPLSITDNVVKDLGKNLVGLFSAILFSFFSSVALAERLAVVVASGKGISMDRAQALSDALTEAVGKVNPTSIKAFNETLERSREEFKEVKERSETSYTGVNEVNRMFSTATDGVIKSWDITSERRNQASEYVIEVRAEIFRLTNSKQMDRRRISVVLANEKNLSLNNALKEAIEETLTKSRKFAVLQDNSSEAVKTFVTNLKAGGRPEDMLRLRGPSAPEIIAVVGVGELLDGGSRIRGNISIEVIDYASGQIKYKDSNPLLLIPGNKASAIKRVRIVGSELGKQLLENIYPPVVVGWDGQYLTVGQGDGFFNKSDLVEIKVSMGKLRDKYTGEFLEEDLVELCKAVIVSVSSRTSLAKPQSPCGSPFVSGSRKQISEIDEKLFVVSRVKFKDDASIGSSDSPVAIPQKKSDFQGLFKTD